MHACMHSQALSHVRFFATPWTVACQAPLFMEFSKQEYFLLQVTFLTWGLNQHFLRWQAVSLPLNHLEDPTVLYS